MRFARVPTGEETCGWCFMLASRGFAYQSEKTAEAASHTGCDCTVMAGFDGMHVDGYDPDGMYDRWNDCVRTVGGNLSRIETRAMWDAMTEDERRAYKGGFKRFHTVESTRAAREEAERRDWRWLYYGEVPEVDYSANPVERYGILRRKSERFNPADYSEENFKGYKGEEWRDLFTHDALVNHGMSVKAIPANSPSGYSNIDLLIDGQLWEVKSPYDGKGANPESVRFIEKRFEEASAQFENQYDPVTQGKLQYVDGKRVVLNLRYRKVPAVGRVLNKVGFEMRNNDIAEVLVIFPDGSLRRIR